jgi:hypothetical protein
MVMLGTREMLLQQRNRCFNQLRALSPAAANLVTELEAIDMALDNFSSRGAAQYTGFRRAIEAIVASLTIHDRAMTPDELSEDIIAGGWLSKDDRARFNVLDSIDYHTRRKGHGQKKKLIRAINGRIGLYSWPDVRFGVLNTPPAHAKFKVGERVKTPDSPETFVIEEARASVLPEEPAIYSVRSEKDDTDTRFFSENELKLVAG